MRTVKIQLGGQFAIDRDAAEPLWLQLVSQLQQAVEAGRVAAGTRLPSTRSLARELGVSRNTVLTAYEELAARGFVRSRRGAAIYASLPQGTGVDARRVMRDAHYPLRIIALQDQDANPLYLSY